VHKLLEAPALAAFVAQLGRTTVRDAVREVLAAYRAKGGPTPSEQV